MDPVDRRDLDAAIVAHYQWLKSVNVLLPAEPPELTAAHLLYLMPTPAQVNAGAHERVLDAWAAPRALVQAVITSLRSLYALAAREDVAAARAAARNRADQLVTRAEPDKLADAKRYAKQARLAQDDKHIRALQPSLVQLGSRLRTVMKKLDTFNGALKVRHRAHIAAGMGMVSSAPSDRALVRWVMEGCDALQADVEFFLEKIEGPIALSPVGHARPADGKAWFRLRGDAKLWFKEAGASSSLATELFPGRHAEPQDPVAKRRRETRGRKELARARKRKESGG